VTAERDAVLGRVMLAFEGFSVPGAVVDRLRAAPAAGFTLFRPFNVKSPEQVRALTASLQEAAGGGLLIAAALLVPGNRTRRRALAENSPRAMHLIAASTLLLIVAGSLEGPVSPIPNWPLWAKASVSAATAVVLALYLSGGINRQIIVGDDDKTRYNNPLDLISR